MITKLIKEFEKDTDRKMHDINVYDHYIDWLEKKYEIFEKENKQLKEKINAALALSEYI